MWSHVGAPVLPPMGSVQPGLSAAIGNCAPFFSSWKGLFTGLRALAAGATCGSNGIARCDFLVCMHITSKGAMCGPGAWLGGETTEGYNTCVWH